MATRSEARWLVLRARRAGRESAQGEPAVRWAYEILAPIVVGVVALAVLAAAG